jgi:hypothetical protein
MPRDPGDIPMVRFALLLALAAPALAQTPAAQPAARPAIPGVSPAGMAAIEKYRGKGDPEFPALVRAQRDAQQKLVTATLAAKIDPERIATLVDEAEEARAAVRVHQNEQMMKALREMPEADRAPFLRSAFRPITTAR